ncbi:DeoR/GlpR family DNA-binding transcription regulator [Amnibacterium endophyticum]|uniref:DeoR/GlpR family DNA-binding transcription regulator n=1 Tax=Amnibacterium endophyticum TaxID=2109337 RepID=A0ABW4LD33_9MICO
MSAEDGAISSAARRDAIAALLHGSPLSVDELALRFRVSPSTVRRDLALLSGSHPIVRTYGGAVHLTPAHEKSLAERTPIAAGQKQAIGRLAASFVGPGQRVILDGGTTVGALAAQLAGTGELTVLTNSLTAVRALEHDARVELVLLGGSLRRVSSATIGPLAEAALADATADAVFLGADSLVAGRGLLEQDQQQASLKRAMLHAAADRFVLVDSSKLGLDGAGWWARLEPPWHLVTDAGATDEQLEPFRALPGVRIHLAGEASGPR